MARASLGPGSDGILVVNKPAGPTSHDIVALVRRLSATRRVGHGGTLDPFASGVLPVFLGQGTRVVEYHLGDTKRYRATVCFGGTSTTDDLEGELTPADGPPPDRAAVEGALAAFRGPITQRPPAYSAIKVAGRRAYAMARAGTPVVLADRAVTIHAIDLSDWDETDSERPIAVVDVVCSAGTYVRAIARDLGLAVGGGAYLGGLTRTASGPFELTSSRSLDDVRAAVAEGPAGLTPLLLPIDAGLEAFPIIDLDDPAVAAIARGQFISVPAAVASSTVDGAVATSIPADHYRLRAPDGRLIAIATRSGARLAPDKVFVTPDVAGGVATDRTVDPLAARAPDPDATVATHD